MRLRRLLVVALLALTAPPAALARGSFDPTTEFEQKEWVPIHLGPLNLSITKAVVYLMLGTVVTILFGYLFMRAPAGRKPGRRETLGEMVYEIAQTQVAEQGLPSKAISRWFPYVASLMLFIFVVNLLGFIPLPLTGETYHGIPTWGIYAATSSLSVTLALSLLTFVFTHVEGIRWNGAVRYFKSWIPEAPKPLLILIVPLEILGQFMRLISLSVRLFANMLAGHITLAVFGGFVLLLLGAGFWMVLAPVPLLAITALYALELLVACLQAFVFATLTCVYLNDAIHPGH